MVDGVTYRFLEVFDETVWVDSATLGDETVTALHLKDTSAAIMVNDGYAGEAVLDALGAWPLTVPAGDAQIGLPFEAIMSPWPQYLIESPRRGIVKGRVVRFAVSVQDTATFSVELNGTKRTVGGYAFGNDLGATPPRLTKVYRFHVLGNRDYPDLRVIRENPGPFRVLALTQEVSG